MNKTVKKVFMLIGLLVVIFIAWQLVFNDGGILKTGYNAIVKGINGQWAKVAGSGRVYCLSGEKQELQIMDRASILIQSSQLNILVVIRGSHLVVELPLFYRREIDNK